MPFATFLLRNSVVPLAEHGSTVKSTEPSKNVPLPEINKTHISTSRLELVAQKSELDSTKWRLHVKLRNGLILKSRN